MLSLIKKFCLIGLLISRNINELSEYRVPEYELITLLFSTRYLSKLILYVSIEDVKANSIK